MFEKGYAQFLFIPDENGKYTQNTQRKYPEIEFVVFRCIVFVQKEKRFSYIYHNKEDLVLPIDKVEQLLILSETTVNAERSIKGLEKEIKEKTTLSVNLSGTAFKQVML